MTTDYSQRSGCGAAVVGFIVLGVLGWVIAGIIPVYCEWHTQNNFETAKTFVLGIPVGSSSGPRGVHKALIEQTHQNKLMVVAAVLGLLGALIGGAIGKGPSENDHLAKSNDSERTGERR